MHPIERLLEIMAQLRSPEGGCPWDLEQTFASIAPYTIEEAYEVDDAIRRGDMRDLQGELGDLLLQVVFHAQMAREAGLFGFDDVVRAICEKLVARHPHVFGEAEIATASAQTENWDRLKEAERRERSTARGRAPSALDEVPVSLPALLRAAKLQRRAERAGFDWSRGDATLELLAKSFAERSVDARALGSLLFAAVQLAGRAGIDPETALREANAAFEARFRETEGGEPAGDRRRPGS